MYEGQITQDPLLHIEMQEHTVNNTDILLILKVLLQITLKAQRFYQQNTPRVLLTSLNGRCV